MSGLDARTSGEIFRSDKKLVLAANRHQAAIFGVRMAYKSGGYVAGTVVARNTVSTYYEAYNDAGSSGLNTAAGVLFHDVEPALGDTEVAQVIFKGQVYTANLVGMDANGIVDLKAREVIDASGVSILMF